MMVEDLGIEARESAVREVAKLLPLPELLSSISSIKSDYVSRQQLSEGDTNEIHFTGNGIPAHKNRALLQEQCTVCSIIPMWANLICSVSLIAQS
ncbi:hypothetical protein GIB67_022652 [Kingdonia uniflora]|uniref:Uncharacterized protein n=1 Tax=Kingdonia uniflora TaxID=39325 RepID=A0A7J7P8I4_9MAGN|nr:hypothetical protein GIB67_022652 [Kingdonia uniflora]